MCTQWEEDCSETSGIRSSGDYGASWELWLFTAVIWREESRSQMSCCSGLSSGRLLSFPVLFTFLPEPCSSVSFWEGCLLMPPTHIPRCSLTNPVTLLPSTSMLCGDAFYSLWTDTVTSHLQNVSLWKFREEFYIYFAILSAPSPKNECAGANIYIKKTDWMNMNTCSCL